MNDYLDSCDAELSQSHLYRLFALGCFDLIVTLPIAVTNLVFNFISDPSFIFYQGWTLIHSDWEPALIPKSIWSADKVSASTVYWDEWINPFLALVFFALFGLTSEAREEYRKLFRFLRRPFAVRQADIKEEVLPEAVFECGRVTDATNISGRYVLIILPICKHSSLKSHSYTQADILAWRTILSIRGSHLFRGKDQKSRIYLGLCGAGVLFGQIVIL